MSETNKRYFWLKLKDDFFGQKEIKMLRRIAGGDTYTIIYLKMLLLSLKNDGKIYFDGIAENFVEEIALDIDEDTENTQITFNYLAQKGLIEFSDAELEMTNIASMIGSESDAARRKRKQRSREKNLISDNVTPKSHLGHTEIEIELEKELETDIEKDKDTDKETEKKRVGVVFDKFQELGFGTINGFTAEQINEHLQTFEPEVVIKALEVASNNNKRNLSYANGILKNWKQRNIITLEDVKAAEQQREIEQASGYNKFTMNRATETRPKWLDEDKAQKRANVQELKPVIEDKELSDLINKFRES